MNCAVCGFDETTIVQGDLEVCMCCGFLIGKVEPPVIPIKINTRKKHPYDGHSYKARARAAMEIFRYQFPDVPGRELGISIIENAIMDIVKYEPKYRAGKEKASDFARRHDTWATFQQRARTFLTGDMDGLDEYGVSPGWIRRILTKCGIPFTNPSDGRSN